MSYKVGDCFKCVRGSDTGYLVFKIIEIDTHYQSPYKINIIKQTDDFLHLVGITFRVNKKYLSKYIKLNDDDKMALLL